MMAPYYGYNNFYNPYQQAVPDQLQQLRNQVQQPQMMQSAGTVDDRIFVQGELAAQAYLVAPSSFVRLWDSTQNVFYEKRADQTGRPYMETFEYKKLTNAEPKRDYDSRFDEVEKRLRALEGVMNYVPESNADNSTV